MFASLPVLFQKIPGGNFVSILFFLLVSFAALTSAISILEVVVAYIEEKWKWSHKKSVCLSAFAIYLMGYLSLFSTNTLSEFKFFGGKTFFDFFDVLSSSYLLPMGGLVTALFLGWKLSLEACEKIVGSKGFLALGLMWSARLIAPLGVIAVLVNKVLS